MKRRFHIRSRGSVQKRGWFLLLFLMVLLISTTFVHPIPTRAATGSWQTFTYSGTAGSRPYFVYTPADYTPDKPVPMLVMLHGCTQTAADFAAGTQMDELADQYDFIVVYPQQDIQYNTSGCWNWFATADQARGVGEPAIIAGIVQTVENDTAQWAIDKKRVYVAGISAGAAMAVVMGATYPDLFAAIGVHSGLEYQAATDLTSALLAQELGGPNPNAQGQIAYDAMGSHAQVVPTIVFQGTSDTTVAPVNGTQVIEQWMKTDNLASGGSYDDTFENPSSEYNGQVPQGHSYTEYSWNDSKGRELQEYWVVNGLGHAWSGGSSAGSYTDPLGPNASLAMYQFFMNHSK